jgi:hypothetical protein
MVNSFASYDRMGFVQAVRNGAPLFFVAAALTKAACPEIGEQ